MKVFVNILKWIGIVIGSILVLLVLAGFTFRLLVPPSPTPGRLVDVGGFKLHINSTGNQTDKPTLVIEGGAGVSADYFHWLSEGLKDSMRVVRYDRSGMGYSDLGNTPRDPETIARELHTLLEKAGEKPPYILAGHSMGGPCIRVFAQLYPDEVVGLFFLDSSHPDQVKQMNHSREASAQRTLRVFATLADLGLIGLFDRMTGPILAGEGLPEEVNKHMWDLTSDGDFIRGAIVELEAFYPLLERAAEANNFGNIPVRVFKAHKARTDSPQKTSDTTKRP